MNLVAMIVCALIGGACLTITGTIAVVLVKAFLQERSTK